MRRFGDAASVALAWVASLGLLVGVGLLLGLLLDRGGRTLGPTLLFGDVPVLDALLGRARVFEGIWPAAAGTLALVGLSSVIAIPLGVASGVYLSEYAGRRVRGLLDLGVDMLAGIPSVVMGLFGFALILLLRRTLAPHAETGLLLAAACIALLVLPYVIRTTQIALSGLDEDLRLVGPALGLTRWQAIRHVLLPAASRGILSGVMLSIGRAAEDTAVIMLTGAVWNAGLPAGLTEKFEALPFRIYVTAAEYRNADELARGFGCTLVLLLLTTVLLVVSYVLQRGVEARWRR
jgi:phosphate transport system permease protein